MRPLLRLESYMKERHFHKLMYDPSNLLEYSHGDCIL